MSCTVVIPTLGGPSLKKTISLLNSGSLVPDEILICIPKGIPLKNSFDDNVCIIRTPEKGQVKQRIYGFKHANNKYVMQLDDDIYLDSRCLENLIESVEILGPNTAVSPAMINSHDNKSVYKKINYNRYITYFYYWLMNGNNGYRQGEIDKSGSAIGVDTDQSGSRYTNVQWLPGGCVMHSRNNLILDNYWYLNGKAYYEDIIHSLELTKNGLRLYIDSNAICYIDTVMIETMTLNNFVSDIVSDFHARKSFLDRYYHKNYRMYLFYIFRITNYIYKKLSNTFKYN